MKTNTTYSFGLAFLIVMLFVNVIIIHHNSSDYHTIIEHNRELLNHQSARDEHKIVHHTLWRAYNDSLISSDSLRRALYKDFPEPLICPFCKKDVVVAYHKGEYASDSTHIIAHLNLDYDTNARKRRMYCYDEDVEWICTFCYRHYYEDDQELREIR